MSDRHPIRNGIIATVAGGLILSALGWAFGFLPRIVSVLVALGRAVGTTLLATISIPVWLLVAVLLLISLVIRHYARIHPTPAPIAIDANKPATEQVSALGAQERAVLKMLADLDGNGATIDDISGVLRQPRLVVSAAVEKIMRLGLVRDTLSTLYGARYFLTSQGRDWVIEQGMVRSP